MFDSIPADLLIILALALAGIAIWAFFTHRAREGFLTLIGIAVNVLAIISQHIDVTRPPSQPTAGATPLPANTTRGPSPNPANKENWTHRATLTDHTSGVNAVAFSPDGTTLATGSHDYTARLWRRK